MSLREVTANAPVPQRWRPVRLPSGGHDHAALHGRGLPLCMCQLDGEGYAGCPTLALLAARQPLPALV